jgi:hypothetical protein
MTQLGSPPYSVVKKGNRFIVYDGDVFVDRFKDKRLADNFVQYLIGFSEFKSNDNTG